MSRRIYISIRVDRGRKKDRATKEDVSVRSKIISALVKSGFKVIGTGEGSYADVWVTDK